MDQTRLSLLERARDGSASAWDELDRLYRPFVGGWLRRQGLPVADADDLTQDVLAALARDLASFDHSGRPGALRAWLRTACLHRVQGFQRQARQAPIAGTEAQVRLSNLIDENGISDDWDRQHDRHVLRGLLAGLDGEFEERTLAAFRRLAVDGAPGRQVAAELGLSVAAVYMARSRVLRRLRELATEMMADGPSD